jgi:aminoglycoside phosphotransferase (APT) family kinase protein
MTADGRGWVRGTLARGMRRPDVDPGALERLLRRAFPDPPLATYERTPEGVSTQVYRLHRAGTTYYLRIGEDENASLAPEGRLHQELRSLGLAVPEAIYFEPFDEALQRSVMITGEIPGASTVRYVGAELVSTDVPAAQALPGIFRAAGRDLARINQLPVDGYGWVRRDPPPWPLRGELPVYADWVAVDHGCAALGALGLPGPDVDRVGSLLQEQVEGGGPGLLVHGDFDLTHVFHSGGRYTGIIDFGEIRGADRWYDLAVFGTLRMSGSEPAPDSLGHLEDGYAEITPLPPDYRALVTRTAVMICVQALARGHDRAGTGVLREPWVTAKLAQLRALLADQGPWRRTS